MKISSTLCFILIAISVSAQKQKVYKETGGLTAYYFWEEDSMGYVIDGRIEKPYLQNFLVRFDSDSGRVHSRDLQERTLREVIADFTNENGSSRKKKVEKDSSVALKIPLKRIPATYPTSMILSKKANIWSSRIRNNVLYFTFDENDRIRFSHASDSLVLSTSSFRRKTEGHYVVYNYLDKDKHIIKQKLYNYTGVEISGTISELKVPSPERYLIFSNGYRGYKKNKDKTDNLITNFDRYNYWYKLDDSIIQRLNPSSTYYIDGSMGVNTSAHRSTLRFGISYAKASIFKRSTKAKRILNTEENQVGFETRKQEGRIAGRTFLRTRCSSPNCEMVKDTIDLVCHSMGYAYALGFMEEIKDRVVFGRIFILAPESACVDGFEWQLCEEVWQYGSVDSDAPISELDVIAPQCMVKELETLPPNRGGRIFIPSDVHFDKIEDLHDTKYFDWILYCIPEDSPGYVKR